MVKFQHGNQRRRRQGETVHSIGIKSNEAHTLLYANGRVRTGHLLAASL